MPKIILSILFILATYSNLIGQDSLNVALKDSTFTFASDSLATIAIDSALENQRENFGVRIKEKFNFNENFEFFKNISESKAKCESDFFDIACAPVHNGKTIRNIYVEVLDPFGHVDTSQVKRPKIYKLANGLHQSTPERIIRQYLLFKEGDPVDTKVLYESGRTLFESSYFRNAEIAIVEAPEDPSVVDIYVITQDLWSWSFWGEASDKYVGGSLGFNKFAGLPQTFSGGLKFNFDKKNPITPTLNYNFRNIGGTFTDAGATWIHDWNNYTYEFRVKRGFFSSKPQWAGAGSVGWYRAYQEQTKETAIYNKQDFWLARSFPFKFKQHDYLNIIAASSVSRQMFTELPNFIEEEREFEFLSRTSYLFAIGIANRFYIKEKNLFDFYEYRNLPSGFNMHIVGGLIDNTKFNNRGYLGGVANHSLMTCAGYFQEEFGMGTYFNDGLEQLTFHLKSKFFTHRIPLKEWGFRQFVYQTFAFGFLRPEGAGLNLTANDVKGLRQNYDGNSYYSINLETEIHSPIRFMGFQARIFVFADLGVQGNVSNVPLANVRLHHAYGFGARLNNWKLGIGYLELAFVYYPSTSGIYNNAFEFSQRMNNSKVIESNSLYNQTAVSVVN